MGKQLQGQNILHHLLAALPGLLTRWDPVAWHRRYFSPVPPMSTLSTALGLSCTLTAALLSQGHQCFMRGMGGISSPLDQGLVTSQGHPLQGAHKSAMGRCTFMGSPGALTLGEAWWKATKQLCPQPLRWSLAWPSDEAAPKGTLRDMTFACSPLGPTTWDWGSPKLPSVTGGLTPPLKMCTFRDATKQSQSGEREHQMYQVLPAMAAKTERLQGKRHSWRSLKTQKHASGACAITFFYNCAHSTVLPSPHAGLKPKWHLK